MPVPPFISHAILGKSFLGRSIALLCESMGCESFLRTSKCCTIVSYKYIGGGVGEKRSTLRDFPPDPTDSRIGLWLQVGQEGPKPLVFGGWAWPGQPSPKCPLGGSRGAPMEP